jgi:hypothetical protein
MRGDRLDGESEPMKPKMPDTRTNSRSAGKSRLISGGVITVGDGRGFVVQGLPPMSFGMGDTRDRLVITAAHCLPTFPPCRTFNYLSESTYKALLAPLGGKPTVWAECLFADPIGDIAVLGQPNNQELTDEAEKYEALMEATTPFAISDAPTECQARLLGLDGQWFRCAVQHINDGPLWVSKAMKGIAGGMSGSPIVADDGSAIGIVCTSSGGIDLDKHTEGGPNPRLINNLPGWLLRELMGPRRTPKEIKAARAKLLPRSRPLA